MGKASREKQTSSRRERIAAQRAADRRRQVRNRILIAAGAVVVVIVVVVVFVVIAVTKPTSSTTSKPSANGPTGTALAKVVADTTSVPASTLATVGAGSVTSPPSSVNGTPSTSGGKPEMLYIGAEYCPYCAFERWGMVVALSRFGTFKGLSTTHSSSTDVYPNTPTWTFYKSSYTSKYVAFSSVEETTNQLASNGQGYVPLQSPTAAQEALINKYDAPPYVPAADKGAIPFVYIGGKYLISGASALPSVLSGKSWASIASSLKDPGNAVAKAVNGTANYITAAICKTTNDQPSNVCTSGVTALQSKMPAAG
jgi:thiol-disulfide isomerase/thioredoxin